jgi:excinuclease ABC subunit B
VGETVDRDQLIADARRAAIQAQRRRLPARHLPRARRHDRDLPRPLRGPGRGASRCFGDEIEEIAEFDPLTGKKTAELDNVDDLRQQPLRRRRGRR